MSKLDIKHEKDGVDLVTNAMYSLSFLQSINDHIFFEKSDTMTVGQFYNKWLKDITAIEPKVPFSLGAILGYLYIGILFTKEHWFDLLPDIEYSQVDTSWGISNTEYISPKNPNPTFKYVVRRIRNALGHGYVIIDTPKVLKDKGDRFTKVYLKFHDVNSRDADDTFDVRLSIEQLFKFVKAFQSLVYNHVRNK